MPGGPFGPTWRRASSGKAKGEIAGKTACTSFHSDKHIYFLSLSGLVLSGHSFLKSGIADRFCSA